MSTQAIQVRKKPVEVEALHYDGSSESLVALYAWSSDVYDSGPEGEVYIATLEGDLRAEVGDWIIKGVAGEFYPCKPDIFEATYEWKAATEGTERTVLDAARRLASGTPIRWCVAHGSAAPVEGVPCERGVGTARLRGEAAELEVCQIEDYTLVKGLEAEE